MLGPFRCRQLVEQGKRCNEYELHLEQSFFDASLRDLIVKDATVVLINNLVFPEVTDEHIKKEFISEMADGTRIVSTRAFATRQRGVNARNVNGNAVLLIDHMDKRRAYMQRTLR